MGSVWKAWPIMVQLNEDNSDACYFGFNLQIGGVVTNNTFNCIGVPCATMYVHVMILL
jgi:hypothetical protein